MPAPLPPAHIPQPPAKPLDHFGRTDWTTYWTWAAHRLRERADLLAARHWSPEQVAELRDHAAEFESWAE
ncbi:hypothetical protein [Saccharothrix hoggarensis]|uniref:Uncharacterized protein n=1 Tax=Saccharothrix hoggarensis TaxID=913853 RepID=A0ABW3QDS6_9PSEU